MFNLKSFQTLLIGILLINMPLLGLAEEKPMTKKKILVLTFSEGFKHSALELAEQTLAKLGNESGLFEADCLNQWKLTPDEIDLSFLTAAKLNEYDAIFMYTSSGRGPEARQLLTDEQKKAWIEYIKSGKALITCHSATDTFFDWPEFGEMVGGYFVNHPWGANDAPVTIKVEDRHHPATAMLGDSWVIQDEIYQFKEPYSREKLHVLMSLDTSKTDMNKQGLLYGKDGDYGLAWCREYGKGRCFFTALGHREDVWTNPTFQAHLLGGIKWALRFEEAGRAAARP